MLAAGGADHHVGVWQVSDKKILTMLKSHTANVAAIRFSLGNKFLFTAGHDRVVKMWMCEDWTLVREFKRHSAGIYAIRQHHKWPYLLFTAGGDGIVNIFNINTGEHVGSLNPEASNIRSMNFSPSGEYLVVGTHSYKTVVWNLTQK